MEKIIQEQSKFANVLFSDTVTKLNDHNNGTDERPCVITDTQIAYYKGKKEHKTYQWSNIIKANYEKDKKQFNFVFNPNKISNPKTDELCRFQVRDSEKLAEILGKFLTAFLSDNEKTDEINLSSFTTKIFAPTQRQILARLRSMTQYLYTVDKNKPRQFDAIMNIIQKILVERQQTVYIEDKAEKMGNAVIPVIYALQSCKYAETLVEPIYKGNFLNELVNAASKYFPFKHLIIRSKDLKNIEKLFNNLYEGFKTEAFSFESIPMNEKLVKTIGDALVSRKTTSLGFWDCFNSTLLDTVCENIINKLDSLIYLNFKTTMDVNINDLCDRIKTVKHLSLEHVGVDASEIIKCICQTEFTQLESLCITGNNAENPFVNGELPTTLLRIDASYVTWSEGILHNFLEFLKIQKSQYRRQLYLAAANINEGEAKECFNVLKDNFNLDTLCWSFNPIVEETADFFKSAKTIRSLKFNYCFNADTEKFIEPIANAIKKMTKLEEIYIRGDEKCYIGESITPILEAIEGLPNISLVDVSGHKFGSVQLEIIEQILEASKSITRINFDDCNIEAAEPITSIIEKAKERRTKLQISFPRITLNKLVDDGVINKDTYDKLIEDVVLIENQGYEGDIVFDNYDYFVIHEDDRYPNFATEEFLDSIEKAKIPVEEESSESSSSSSSSDKPQEQENVKDEQRSSSDLVASTKSDNSESSEKIRSPNKKPVQLSLNSDSSDSSEVIQPKKKPAQVSLNSDSSESSEPLPPPKKLAMQVQLQSISESEESSDIKQPKNRQREEISESDSESDSFSLPPKQQSKKVPDNISSESESSDSFSLPPKQQSKKVPDNISSESESSDSFSLPPKQEKRKTPIDSISDSDSLGPEQISPPKDNRNKKRYDLSSTSSEEEEERPVKKHSKHPAVIKKKYQEPQWSVPENVNKPFNGKKVSDALQEQFNLDSLLQGIM